MKNSDSKIIELNKKEKNSKLLRKLFGLSFIISLFPTAFSYSILHEHVIEIYVITLSYTLVLLMLAYFYYMNYTNLANKELKALIKKESVISGELVLINTEEKLKNILSLEIERCQNSQSESTIVFFDVDDLGSINDKYGYNVGDQLLIEIILGMKQFINETQYLNESGALLARIKGDKFAILMPKQDSSVAYKEIENIKKIIEQIKINDSESITCRFAVLSINQWVTEEKLLNLAHEKLKLAKDYGKGVVV